VKRGKSFKGEGTPPCFLHLFRYYFKKGGSERFLVVSGGREERLEDVFFLLNRKEKKGRRCLHRDERKKGREII